MTPLLTSPLVIALACLSFGAQVEQPPVTGAALEGVWRESLLPGERPADRLVVTIRDEGITVIWYEGVYRGALPTSSLDDRTDMGFSITLIGEKGERRLRTHNCRCLNHDDQLFLQIFPVLGLGSGDHPLDLAPVKFRLEKVKK